MKIESAVLSMLFFAGSGLAVVYGNESTDDSPEINSLYDAATKGKVKGLVRYSGQYRDSNLHEIQDSATPDPEIMTEKKTAILSNWRLSGI